jgi:hypothetical protein
MMKRIHVFVLLFLVGAFACNASAQAGTDTPHREPKLQPVSDDIAEQLVQLVLMKEFKASDVARTVYLSDKLLKPEWLPVIPGINFVLLNASERKGRGGYGFKEIWQSEGMYHVYFGEWALYDCSGQGSTTFFRQTVHNIEQIKELGGGWSEGCGSADAVGNPRSAG